MSRRLQLAAEAQQDIRNILAFSIEAFGRQQASRYARTLNKALSALRDRADFSGSRMRDDLKPGLRSFHTSRIDGRARHVIYFKVETDVVLVARILHEAMDAARHLRD